MNARWEKIPTSNSPSFAISQSTAAWQWVVVDEHDEIIATVVGSGQTWQACEQYRNGGPQQLGGARSGTFLTEDAAKTRVEDWLHPTYSFVHRQTAWVYAGVTP